MKSLLMSQQSMNEDHPKNKVSQKNEDNPINPNHPKNEDNPKNKEN